MMWGYGWGWGYWLVMGVTMILFWGLLIVGIVALVRHLGGTRDASHLGGMRDAGGPGPGSGRTRAEEVLAERFARGEIDEDEYKRRLELLRTG
jgi:putative membrane protein